MQEGDRARIGKQVFLHLQPAPFALSNTALPCFLARKSCPDTQIWNPVRSAVKSALTCQPKPHPLLSCFSNVFCNVILIFIALGRISRLWFPFWSSVSAVHFFLRVTFSSSPFFTFHFIFISGDLSSSKLAVSITSDIPFWRMIPIFQEWY